MEPYFNIFCHAAVPPGACVRFLQPRKHGSRLLEAALLDSDLDEKLHFSVGFIEMAQKMWYYTSAIHAQRWV